MAEAISYGDRDIIRMLLDYRLKYIRENQTEKLVQMFAELEKVSSFPFSFPLH